MGVFWGGCWGILCVLGVLDDLGCFFLVVLGVDVCLANHSDTTNHSKTPHIPTTTNTHHHHKSPPPPQVPTSTTTHHHNLQVVYGLRTGQWLPAELPRNLTALVITYEELHTIGGRHPRPHLPPRGDALATICYTSGTTGVPKVCCVVRGICERVKVCRAICERG